MTSEELLPWSPHVRLAAPHQCIQSIARVRAEVSNSVLASDKNYLRLAQNAYMLSPNLHREGGLSNSVKNTRTSYLSRHQHRPAHQWQTHVSRKTGTLTTPWLSAKHDKSAIRFSVTGGQTLPRPHPLTGLPSPR